MDWWWQEFKGARRVIIIVIGTINTRAAAKRVNFGDATTNLHGITIEDIPLSATNPILAFIPQSPPRPWANR